MRILPVILCAGSALVPLQAQTFTDVTAPAGLTYLQHAAVGPPDCLLLDGMLCEPERMSGGAAVADVDGDGWADLFVTRLDAPDILFRNRGDGTFEDVTRDAGLAFFDLQSNGAGFADLDNDGDADLLVTTMGEAGDPVNWRNYLFINDGTGRFAEEAELRGVTMRGLGMRTSFSAAFGDYDRDGWLDLHVTEWLADTISNSRLLRNLGASAPGHFEDLTDVAGVVCNSVFGFSSAFTDLDADGWPDLVVAADFGTSRLFWNDRDGTFTDGTVAAGVGTDENGMGSTVADFDGDGDLDWFVTSIFDPDDICQTEGCTWGTSGNRLYSNEGGRSFSDATDATGVRDGRWGWGAGWIDFDNDGDLDLAMTNGVDFPTGTAETPFHDDPMRLWRNDGPGPMSEIATAAGLADTGSGKGLLRFDYDRDGDLDLFVVNNAAAGHLFRNDGGNDGDWLRVVTVGTVSNRDGIGARVLVEALPGQARLQEVGSATHFLARSESTAHFGLGGGSGSLHRVTVEWPSGTIQQFDDVARNTTLVAVEPACTDADADGYCAGIDCADGDPAIHPGGPDRCANGVDDNCDLAVDEAGCVHPVAAVPDGDTVPGLPLRIAREAGGQIRLSWSAPCSEGPLDYAIYRGSAGDFTSHTPLTCSTGGAEEWTFAPTGLDDYYLVVAIRAGNEGSYGNGGNGAERARDYTSACRIRAVESCE